MSEEKRCPRCGGAFAPDPIEGELSGMCPKCLAALLRTDPGAPPVTSATRMEAFQAPFKAGAVFHGLEIVELIGTGGMGVVYKARQTSLGRQVALKLLGPAFAASPEFTARFEREAKVLASVSHANIVHVYDFGKEGDLLFLVMEHVDGPTLEAVLREKRPVDPAGLLGILRDVTRGLQRVHEAGLVHRDIKPANILIAKDGAKIGDFGLAVQTEDTLKLTESGMFVGTPHYVSPEHVQGKKVDGRSDLYSLGVILYEGLAGRPPFTGPSATAILMKHVQESPPPLYKFAPNLPPILGEITRKLLAKNPAARHDSAGGLQRDLERALEALRGHAPAEVRPAPTPATRRAAVAPPPAPKPKPPWKWLAGGAAALVAVVVGILAFTSGSPKAPEPPPTPPPVVSKKPDPVRKVEEPKPAPVPVPLPPEPVPPPSAPPVERKPEELVQLSTQEKRRQLDHYTCIINLAAVAAYYADLRGHADAARKLRETMTQTQEKLDALLAQLRQEGQNPYVDDLLRPADLISWFENRELYKIGTEASAALLGTFVAQIKGGSRARVAVLRDGATKEFVIRFDERPADLLTILQVVGLIPGQTVKGPAGAAEAPKPSDPAPTPAAKPPDPPTPKPAPPPEAPRKQPVPDAAAQKEAEKSIREIYKAEFAKKAPADVAILAQKLYQQGRQEQNDAKARFVLLSEARDLAAQAGDLETCLAATDELGRGFEVDGVALKSSALNKMAANVRRPEVAAPLADAFCRLAEEAVGAENYDAAATAATKAEALARGAQDGVLAARAQDLRKEIAFVKEEYQKVKGAIEKPGTGDQEAVGKFFCFVKGEWDRGLPILAAAAKPPLNQLAQKDVARPADAAGQVEVADGWWDLAEKERQPIRKQRLLERTKQWYELAFAGATGLVRAKVEKRLETIDGLDRGPVNLLKLIDPRIDSIQGSWRFDGGTLVSPQEWWGRLQIRYIPPEEYDFHAVVERKVHDEDFYIGLPRGEAFMGVGLDAGHSAYTVLGDTGIRHQGAVLPQDRAVSILCSVRRRELTVTVDGRKLLSYPWKGDEKRSLFQPGWDIPNKKLPFIGAHGTVFRISKLTLVPVSGQGKVQRLAGTAPPAAPSTGPAGGAPVGPSAPLKSVGILPKGAVDLLALIDPKKDASRGAWEGKGAALITPAAIDTLLQVPYVPPAEYDLDLSVEWKDGPDGFGIGVAHGEAQVMMMIGSWHQKHAGLRFIEGVMEDRNETSYTGALFVKGKPLRVVCAVRSSSLEVMVDGKRILQWKADWKRVSPGGWETPTKGALALTSLYGTYEVSRLVLTPVSGTGRMLRVPPPPAKPVTPAGKAAIDVLALVDPKKDAVGGSWSKEGGKLVSDATKFARLEIPYQPPAEYDLTVVFSRVSGASDINQILCRPGKQFVWVLGAGDSRYGFGLVRGQWTSSPTNPTIGDRPGFPPGKEHTSVIQVRKDAIRAYLDGELLREVKTDYSDFSMAPGWTLRSENLLGLASFESPTAFHKVEIVEVTGRGRRTR